MVKHRGLNLQKFIYALPWDLFEAYFKQLDARTKPNAWAWLNPGNLFQFLDDEQNAEASGVILEDFQRINDLGFYTPFLLYAYERAGIAWPQDEPGEAGAMRLFLADKDAFEYAWTLYLLQTTPGRRCEYYFPAGALEPTAERKEQLRANLSGWFSSIKRGDQCITSIYKDGTSLYVRIARGRHMKTDARWKGYEVTFETFRPASEDVLTYSSDRSLLTLFGGNRRDRERLIRSFAEYIAGNPDLADTALNTQVFSLEPFRKGTFSYGGNSAIRRVSLIEVDIVDDLGTLVTLKGPALFASLAARNLSLSTVEVKRVKLHFDIQAEGDRQASEVSVEVQPPVFSDLAQKRYATTIESYLRQQGVKLI